MILLRIVAEKLTAMADVGVRDPEELRSKALGENAHRLNAQPVAFRGKDRDVEIVPR